MCGVDDTHMDEMKFEMVGVKKPMKKFYHSNCFEKHLVEKEFRAKEQVEKDELTEVIKHIYGVKEVPRQAFPLLEAMRNGQPVFGKKQNMGKRYKEGYSYTLIKETFEYCSDTIEYWNSVKNFNGFMGAFKYALSIVIDKIYIVEQRAENRRKQELMMNKHVDAVDVEEHEFVNSYKKKEKPNTDITDFLDD